MAAMTFIYGLLISGYMMDCQGVKISLLLGALCFTFARILVVFTKDPVHIYLIFTTLIPLAMSLCKFNFILILL
jgi:hypothetical protein